MKKRILTGSLILLAVALFISSRLVTTYAFDLFVGVLAIIGCVEVSRVLERKRMFTNNIFISSTLSTDFILSISLSFLEKTIDFNAVKLYNY